MLDVLINDPASRDRLQGALDGRPPFPGTGINGIMLHGAPGTGKTTLANLLPDWLERSGNLPRTIFTDAPFAGEQAGYTTRTACGMDTSGPKLLKRLKTVSDKTTWHSPRGWHYEVLDEVDVLSKPAVESLTAGMSDTTTTIYVFTANDLQKLPAKLRSRCHLIEMNQAQHSSYIPAAAKLLAHHGHSNVVLTDADVMIMAASARGCLRTFGHAVLRAAHVSLETTP